MKSKCDISRQLWLCSSDRSTFISLNARSALGSQNCFGGENNESFTIGTDSVHRTEDKETKRCAAGVQNIYIANISDDDDGERCSLVKERQRGLLGLDRWSWSEATIKSSRSINLLSCTDAASANNENKNRPGTTCCWRPSRELWGLYWLRGNHDPKQTHGMCWRSDSKYSSGKVHCESKTKNTLQSTETVTYVGTKIAASVA